MKAYFLLGTLLLILVGALLKNSMLMDDENPCWAARRTREPFHGWRFQNPELFIQMQHLNQFCDGFLAQPHAERGCIDGLPHDKP